MATLNRYLVYQRLRHALKSPHSPSRSSMEAEVLGVSRKPSRHFTSTRFSSTLFHPVIVEIKILHFFTSMFTFSFILMPRLEQEVSLLRMHVFNVKHLLTFLNVFIFILKKFLSNILAPIFYFFFDI